MTIQEFDIEGHQFGDCVRLNVMDILRERSELGLVSALKQTRFKIEVDHRYSDQKFNRGSFDYLYTKVTIRAESNVYDTLLDDINKEREGQIHSASLRVLGGFNCTIRNPPRIVHQHRVLIDACESPVTQADHNISEFNSCHFRSRAELAIAEALEEEGLPFIVNGRGRFGKKDDRRTFEPDFLVFFDGAVCILEVDGPKHDKRTKPCSDEREIFLYGTGIHDQYIFRYSAEECYNDPLGVLKKFKEELYRLTRK